MHTLTIPTAPLEVVRGVVWASGLTRRYGERMLGARGSCSC
jgi:hypothetical protein